MMVSTNSLFTSTNWDTNQSLLASSTSQGTRIADVSYAGSTLASSTLYYWRIKFWDDQAAEGAWSTATSTFTLEAAASSAATSTLQNISYTYDAVGNITALTDHSGTGAAKTILFGYDDLYRLTHATTTTASSSPFLQTFTYSSLGNITEFRTSPNATTTYTYAGTNYANPHAATTIGGTTLTYDNNGNLTKYGSNAYTWDYQNRITKAGSGTATSTYGYDYQSTRVMENTGGTITRYINKLYSVGGATTTKHIFVGDTLVATVEKVGSATTTHIIHTDHLGGTNVITNANGNVAQVLDYYPYGSPRLDTKAGSFNEKRKYIGEQYDTVTSLSYLNARYYDGGRGQFLSQDHCPQPIVNFK